MKPRIAAGLAPALLLLAAAASAQTAEDRQARLWAASCAACHGTGGRSAGSVPAIAGRDADTLYRALVEFKGAQRSATVMHQHAKGYSDEELKRLAVHFSRQASR